MAIKGEDNNGQNQGTAQTSMGAAMSSAQRQTTQQGTAQQPQPGAQRAPQRGGFRFAEMNRLIPSPMSRTPAGEVLIKTQNAIEEVYKNNINQGYEVTVIAIDYSQTSSLALSTLVVVGRDLNNPGLGVAYHNLVLEGSAEPVQSRVEFINGQNVEILRTAGDVVDARMLATVEEWVRRSYPQAELHNADSEVVPRDFNLADTTAVFSLAANAAYAVTHELEQRRPGFIDINLAEASRDENLTVRIAYPRNQTQDVLGLPIRQDIAIDLTVAAAGGTTQQQAEQRVTPVSRVSGFIDLVYSPETPQQPQYYGAPQQAPTRRYAARFVMTALQSLAASTLPAQLLALVPALALREGNQWVNAFKPTPYSSGDVDLHDIGAIGIEANLNNDPSGIGARIDTKSDSFKPDQLPRIIGLTIKPGLMVSLDVSECGSDTWYNGVFPAAAEGSARANDMIIAAANYLTNNAFSRHFQGNGRVCIDESNRIHMGYYIDRQGVRRDIRDIDYLAVLNFMGEKDLEIVRDWSDTFYRTDLPLPLRLAGRKRIIQGFAGDVVFTGFARRITFEAAFLNALAAACLEAGLDVRSVTPYTDQMGYERATASFVDQALLNPSISGLFNRGMGGAGSQAFGGARSAFGSASRYY